MNNALARSPEETAEIERHKYFLSEKAGYDVGWDQAAEDWDANYAAEFRRDTQHPGNGSNGISMLFKRLFARS